MTGQGGVGSAAHNRAGRESARTSVVEVVGNVARKPGTSVVLLPLILWQIGAEARINNPVLIVHAASRLRLMTAGGKQRGSRRGKQRGSDLKGSSHVVALQPQVSSKA